MDPFFTQTNKNNNTPAKGWGTLTAGRSCLAVALPLLMALAGSHAETAEPIASCGVVKLTGPDPNRMIYLGMTPSPTLADSMRYRRGPIGEWIVPEEVDPNDPAIHGRLMTPTGPLSVRIEVTIDGQPFRTIRESWIDTAAKPVEEEEKAAEDQTADLPGEDDLKAAAIKTEQAKLFAGASPGRWLAGYLKQAGGEVDRFESRWLLAQRIGGPALMELEKFSTPRSSAAPLIHLLDTDNDGTLSASEIADAEVVISISDNNEDGDVTIAEVLKALPLGRRRFEVWNAEPLLAITEEAPSGSPDLSLKVHFSKDQETGRVELVDVVADEADVRSSTTAFAMTMPFGELECSAADVVAAASMRPALGEPNPAEPPLTGPASTGQVSIGGVVEGSPLWGRVDTDQNNLLSRRERSDIVATIASLDRNKDGALTADEIPTRLRLGIAHGAEVHRLLAMATTPVVRLPEVSADVPDWFASMDANRDGDLTAEEFLGEPYQFRQMDANNDGLISLKEAGPTD